MKKIIYFLLVFPMCSLFSSTLDTLAQALDILKNTQETQNDEGLLGPWLLQHHKDLVVAYDENYLEQGIKIYQIKVAQQESNECAIHSFRNCLYIMDMLARPRKDFMDIYTNMVSKKQFEAFITEVGCPRKKEGNYLPAIKLQSPIPKILKLSYKMFLHCILTQIFLRFETTLLF